jgi:hypothetical protein
MSQDRLIAEAIRLGTANLKEWQEYGEKWKSRYDEIIETCRITGNQRDEALDRVESLEEGLNRIFHTTDCTTKQMEIIDELMSFPQNASTFPRGRNEPSQAGRSRNIERESTRDPIGRGGEGASFTP